MDERRNERVVFGRECDFAIVYLPHVRKQELEKQLVRFAAVVRFVGTWCDILVECGKENLDLLALGQQANQLEREPHVVDGVLERVAVNAISRHLISACADIGSGGRSIAQRSMPIVTWIGRRM